MATRALFDSEIKVVKQNKNPIKYLIACKMNQNTIRENHGSYGERNKGNGGKEIEKKTGGKRNRKRKRGEKKKKMGGNNRRERKREVQRGKGIKTSKKAWK